MLGLLIGGFCIIAGGLSALSIASEDDGKTKKDSSYRNEGYDPWTDDSFPY